MTADLKGIIAKELDASRRRSLTYTDIDDADLVRQQPRRPQVVLAEQPASSPRRPAGRHRLLGHRGPQPVNLGAGGVQLCLFHRRPPPARDFSRQRRQRPLFGGPTHLHHGRAVHPIPVGGSGCVA